jgi:hypothetical protein
VLPLGFDLSTTIPIGITEWFTPQISEQFPKNKPGIIGEQNTLLSLPGTASILIPKVGIAKECNTSPDVTAKT